MSQERKLRQHGASSYGAETDETVSLRIFPTEIWLKIIDATNPSELPNIYISSRFFADLFNPTEVLFPPVLKCLLPYISNVWIVLKNCRLVCTSWYNTVNSVLQDEAPHTDIGIKTYTLPSSHHLRHFCVRLSGDYVNTLVKLKNLFKHLEKDRNPIISRHVEIVSSTRIMTTELLVGVKELFRMYGRQIWYCTVVLNHTHCGDFNILRDALKLLPNLKALTLNLWSPSCCLPYKMDSFPHYPNLQYVNIPKDNGNAFQNAVLKNNPQVKSLVLFEDDFMNGGSVSHWTEYTKKLENLAIRCFTIEVFKRIGDDSVNWPLKQLKLIFKSTEGITTEPLPVKWEDMGHCFQIMETKFGQTLKHLTMHFLNISEFTTDFMLCLPKLTSMTLQLACCFSLDFLLPMQNNLRYLEIKVKLSQEQIKNSPPQEKTIRFFTVENISVDSNIWEVFPKLQKLKYCHTPDASHHLTYKNVSVLLRT